MSTVIADFKVFRDGTHVGKATEYDFGEDALRFQLTPPPEDMNFLMDAASHVWKFESQSHVAQFSGSVEKVRLAGHFCVEVTVALPAVNPNDLRFQ